MKEKLRCSWAKGELDIQYHDTEWGVPLHDDNKLFEMLILEGMQAGLSWSIILKRRESFRQALDNFNPNSIQNYTEEKKAELLLNPGIIRNKAKINALPINASAFIKIQQEYGSFDAYIWGFVNNTPIVNHWETIQDVPASTPLSDAISKDLKKRGFKFVGSTICYAYMQGIGLVNDHLISCFRHSECCTFEM